MENEKLGKLFEEFLLIYKVINRKKVIDILQEELNTEQLKEIYQKSDGIRSTREISVLLKNKCSHAKISGLWNKWALLGIVVPTTRKGRYKAAFDLEEYGIATIVEEEDD